MLSSISRRGLGLASRNRQHTAAASSSLLSRTRTAHLQSCIKRYMSRPPHKQTKQLTPIGSYKALVESGLVHEDSHQLQALHHFDKLHHDLVEYDSSGRVGPPPRSMYIWGGPGCGKTFLMDMFFEGVPVHMKRRVHFHDFMLDVHKRLHRLKNHGGDGVSKLCEELLAEAYVLCFDEFQVTDIADAMILRQLMSHMFSRGVVLIATSNRPPTELYKNGLQRAIFLPFIDQLQRIADVHSLESSQVDYRKLKSTDRAKGFYLYPSNATHSALFEQQFATQSRDSNSDRELSVIKNVTLSVYGHDLHVPAAVAGRRIAYFTFQDLCAEMLGAADFIDLGLNFHTIFVRDIPELDLGNRNELRRLITLVDALYENHTQLFVLAEASPLDLLPLNADERRGAVHDEIFAFDRTASRLLEMQSEPYVRECQERHIDGVKWLRQKLSIELDESADEMKLVNMNDKEMEDIFAHYNWGRGIEVAIPAAGVQAALDDLSVILGEELKVTKARQNLAYTEIDTSINFDEFLILLRGE